VKFRQAKLDKRQQAAPKPPASLQSDGGLSDELEVFRTEEEVGQPAGV
jgi:hypothetical protein